MLRLNPNDNQGARHELAPLLATHNREKEAIKLLDDYRESTAFWHYMKALLEFRQGGRSPTARQALQAAFRVNEHVVPLLQSEEPCQFPDSYALGSPEEAAVCLYEQSEAWNATDGFLDWVHDEHSRWYRERAKRLRDAKRRSRNKGAKSERRR